LRGGQLGVRFRRQVVPLGPCIVDQLPKRDQEALLRAIDAFIAARKAS